MKKLLSGMMAAVVAFGLCPAPALASEASLSPGATGGALFAQDGPSDAQTITVGTNEISNASSTMNFEFTAREAGWYSFSVPTSNHFEFELLDSDSNHIAYSLDNGMECELEADKVYYLHVVNYDDLSSYKLEVKKFAEFHSNDPELALGTPTQVSGSAREWLWFKFSPAVSGYYRFYSTKLDNSCDPVVDLYNSKGEWIAGDDDAGGDLEFSLRHTLTAHEQYFIAARTYDGDESTFQYTITVEKAPDLASFTATLKPGATPLTIGNLNQGSWETSTIYDDDDNAVSRRRYFNFNEEAIFSRITATATYSDGTPAKTFTQASDFDSYSYDCSDWTVGGTDNIVQLFYYDEERSVAIPVSNSVQVTPSTTPTTPIVTTPSVTKQTPKITVKKTSMNVKKAAAKKKTHAFEIGAKASNAAKLSYKVTKKNSKITFKKGKVTLKKGVKKGTYSIKVKIRAAATGNYNATSKTVKLTFKVK